MKITSVPALPGGAQGINQIPTSEPTVTTPPVVKEEPKLDEQLSQKYADWAKKEKMFRSKVQAREDALKKREADLEAQKAEYEKSYIPRSRVRELFEKDPANALKELELSGDQLTNALLNQPSPQDLKIRELEAKIATLEGYPDQTKKLLEDRDHQAYETALKQLNADVRTTIQSDPQFEVIKHTASEEDVTKMIEERFKADGTLLTIDAAAKEIEQKLTEELLKCFEIEKVKNLVLQKLQPAPQVPANKQPAPKTLTHSQAPVAQKPMSPRERAILAFEGKLT